MSDDYHFINMGGNNGGGEPELDGRWLSELNRYFDALSDPYCRLVLYYLDDHRTETITIDELARHIAALETEHSPATLSEDESADVRQELYHDQLPRLTDYGIIDYDSRSGNVRFNQPPRILMVLLRVSHLIERPP